MARISLLLILFCSFFYPSTLAQLPSLPNINQAAPLDEAVGIPREAVVLAFRRMNLENIATLRMLEGGEYNVNIRHLENISVDNMVLLTHPDTIDVWIVQEGSGTVITGGEMVGNVHQGGIERFISVGDLMFIPAGLPHGIK